MGPQVDIEIAADVIGEADSKDEQDSRDEQSLEMPQIQSDDESNDSEQINSIC